MEFKALTTIFKHLFNILIFACFSSSVLAQELVLTSGYIRAMPASVPNSAAYFTLENHGAPTRLVAVSSDIAKEAQLHTVLEEDGVVKMRQVEGYNIASHDSLILSPAGNHIMLLGLKAPLTLDEKVALTLTFADGQSMTIELPVAKTAPMSDHNEHHHQH